MEAITQEKLEQIMRYWQEKLKLQQWRIEIELASEERMLAKGHSPANGLNDYHLDALESFIQISLPEFQKRRNFSPVDVEQVVVHELLHLHFAPLGIDVEDPKATFEEQLCQTISRTLVELKRQHDQ